jgi:hypothetical protein
LRIGQIFRPIHFENTCLLTLRHRRHIVLAKSADDVRRKIGMKRIIHAAMAAILVFLISGLALAQTATPESVGLSAERLRRINNVIERRIESRDVSGAVTLVARRGRIAHLEAQGLMDIEANKPMAKDGVFRIASMTKPVVGVAILTAAPSARRKPANSAASRQIHWQTTSRVLERSRSSFSRAAAGPTVPVQASTRWDASLKLRPECLWINSSVNAFSNRSA